MVTHFLSYLFNDSHPISHIHFESSYVFNTVNDTTSNHLTFYILKSTLSLQSHSHKPACTHSYLVDNKSTFATTYTTRAGLLKLWFKCTCWHLLYITTYISREELFMHMASSAYSSHATLILRNCHTKKRHFQDHKIIFCQFSRFLSIFKTKMSLLWCFILAHLHTTKKC